MPDVKMPDGTIIKNVPDGMTQDQLTGMLQANDLHHTLTPAPTKPVSQELGAEEGAMNVFDRATEALKYTANNGMLFPLVPPGSGDAVERVGQWFGLPTTEQAIQKHQDYFAKREQTETPGGWGRFGGEIAATLPVAIEDPILGGGIIGGLTGHGKTPLEISADVALGAGFGKFAHGATGYILRKSSPYLRSAPQRATDYISRLMEGAGRKIEDLTSYAEKFGSKPVMGAEAIGGVGKAALSALGKREGATPGALEGYLIQRRAERASRMQDDMVESTGISPEAAQGELDAVVSKGRQEAKPLYDAAFSVPPRTSARLASFAEDPLIKAGMQHGYRIEQLAALKEGRPFDPDVYGVTGFQKSAPGEAWRSITNAAGEQPNVPIFGKMPTWKTWDAAKTGIDHILETTYRDRTTGRLVLDKMGREIEGVRKALLTELDRLNPAYAAARSRAGDYLSAREAFQEGTRSLFNSTITEKQFADRLAQMSNSDLESLRGGVANHLFNLAQTDRLKPSLLKTPRMKSKLIMAFGRDNAEKLIDRFTAENEMAENESRLWPGKGSQAAEVMATMNEQDVPVEIAKDLSKAAMYFPMGMHHMSAFHLSKAVFNAVKDKVGSGAYGLPVEIRNEIGKMLMMTPDELADELRARPAIVKDIQAAFARVQHGATRVSATGATELAP